MDEEVRGFIEKAMDKMMQYEFINTVKWVEQEVPIKSLKDLTLGYIIGGAITLASTLSAIGEWRTMTDEDKIEIYAMVKRRLPEIMEKITRELGT